MLDLWRDLVFLFALADEAYGEEKGGLPQFDLSHFPSQIFWLAVSFVLLLVVMSRVTLPRLAGVIEERRDRVADDLDDAQTLKTKAEEAEEALENELAEARGKASETLARTREKSAKDAEARKAEAEAKAQEAIDAARARFAEAKADAMESVTAAAAEAARLITKKVAGLEIEDDAASASVKRRVEETRDA